MLCQSCGILWAGPRCSTTRIQYWQFFPNSQKKLMLTDTVFSISHFLMISCIRATCLTRFQQISFVAILSLLTTAKCFYRSLFITIHCSWMIIYEWSLFGLSTVSILSWRPKRQSLPSAVFACYIYTPSSHVPQLRLYSEQWTVNRLRKPVMSVLTLPTICHIVWAGFNKNFLHSYSLWTLIIPDGIRDSLWNARHQLFIDTVDHLGRLYCSWIIP